MLKLPDIATDELRLADWLELTAVVSPDRNSSRGDLEGALRAAGVFDVDDTQALERMLLDTFAELESRRRAAGSGYPFRIDGGLLTVEEDYAAYSYLFCLCLSYVGIAPTRGETYPARTFESLACNVAAAFLGGRGIRFGFPRNADLPKSFSEALNRLCQELIREGDGFRTQPVAWNKDGGLDVVAWRDALDGLPGKLLMFGACAAGHNWEDKLTEMLPVPFCEQWMIQVPVSPILRSFFVPHRLPQAKWERSTRMAGIIFDRCRISHLVPRLPEPNIRGDADSWIQSILGGLE